MKIASCEHITLSDDKTPCDIYYLDIIVDSISDDAKSLISIISENSWINQLDPVSKVSFETKVKATASELVKLFTTQSLQNTVSEEFGEYMISLHSLESLKTQLNHKEFPLAELWKEKIKNNHGFDFHTETPEQLLSFGEAKYISNGNAYGRAAEQVVRFISDDEKKDYGDLLYLKNLNASDESVYRLLNDGKRCFAMGFSVNSNNLELIKKNALKNTDIRTLVNKAQTLYLIGVHIQ